jgi:hypothetical protein
MQKIHVVTLPRLQRALDVVRSELDDHGVWTDLLSDVDVYLETLHPLAMAAYGWHYADGQGWISIPAMSLPRLAHAIGFGQYVSLRDVLRHEYAHAIAHLYPDVLRRLRFASVFGHGYGSGIMSDFDSEQHVTPYAASEPAEDFAETVMEYLRHRGDLPTKWGTQPIRTKWSYVRKLCVAINSGQRA